MCDLAAPVPLLSVLGLNDNARRSGELGGRESVPNKISSLITAVAVKKFQTPEPSAQGPRRILPCLCPHVDDASRRKLPATVRRSGPIAARPQLLQSRRHGLPYGAKRRLRVSVLAVASLLPRPLTHTVLGLASMASARCYNPRRCVTLLGDRPAPRSTVAARCSADQGYHSAARV